MVEGSYKLTVPSGQEYVLLVGESNSEEGAVEGTTAVIDYVYLQDDGIGLNWVESESDTTKDVYNINTTNLYNGALKWFAFLPIVFDEDGESERFRFVSGGKWEYLGEETLTALFPNVSYCKDNDEVHYNKGNKTEEE